MVKKITRDSFFHNRLQTFVAGSLFPFGSGDWYKNKGYGQNATGEIEPFLDFIRRQKTDPSANYYKAFEGLVFELTKVKTQLVTHTICELEVMRCKLDSSSTIKPGTGKHIIYFPGANTYYQACFRDISLAAKETGATIHAFNFPGTGLSSGKVREANDLINTGLSVVTSLIGQGIKPDDIILQGDCYGAGIALEVKRQLAEQADIKVRVIMNNAFKSFKAAVCDMITTSPWLPNILKNIVKRLLEFTGWHITPGKLYKHADPYQCHIQHLGDHTLESANLSGKVSKYHYEIVTGNTKSMKRAPIKDSCPEEYRKDRDELDQKHYVRVKESEKDRLATKFGVDRFGSVNAHFADLCELEMLDGKSVYEGFVNDYISRSDAYIAKHPQTFNDVKENLDRIRYLNPAASISIDGEDAQNFSTVMSLIESEVQSEVEQYVSEPT